MLTPFRQRGFAICLVTALSISQAACQSASVKASGGGSAADMSGPPTLNEVYQARNPRKCAKVMSPPNAAQAAALAQCSNESDTTGSSTPLITLATDVQVEIGSARSFLYGKDNKSDIDPSAKVYPIRGQGTLWQCSPAARYPAGQNCVSYPSTVPSPGICYKTTFGEWNCMMPIGGAGQVQHQKGPTTY
jgi:hypothetical protein